MSIHPANIARHPIEGAVVAYSYAKMAKPASASNTLGPLTNQRKDRFMAKADLTAQRLRELLHYDPESGVFLAAVDSMGGHGHRQVIRAIGTPVGNVANTAGGYALICVDRKNHYAHRLAWLYVHGIFPSGKIDHINGDRLDNRLANLRAVTDEVNSQNRHKASSNSATGLLGVEVNNSGYSARITVNGKRKYLGNFPTPEQAHAAYIAAKRRLHEGCTI